MSHHRDFPIGARVELHPATDDWMRGDRYGTIVGYGRRGADGHHPIRVKLDRSGRTKRFAQRNITVVETNAPLKGVRPAGSNVTEVEHGDLTVLYSYETPVAFLSPRGGYRTEKQWSVTTSKHIGQFFKRHGYDMRGAFKIPQDDLARFVERGDAENPRRRSPRHELTVFDKHWLRVARQTLKMPDKMVGVMGGMSKMEAREIIRELTGAKPGEEEENPRPDPMEQYLLRFTVAKVSRRGMRSWGVWEWSQPRGAITPISNLYQGGLTIREADKLADSLNKQVSRAQASQ